MIDLRNYFVLGDLPELLERDGKDIFNENIKWDKVKDRIEENLKTHDANKLIKEIIKYFPNVKIQKISNNDKLFSFKIILTSEKIAQKLYTNDKLKIIVRFFNYNLSYKLHNEIYIEPIYPEKVNDLVYNKSHGILYHVANLDENTNRLDIEKSIKENGLRCKFSHFKTYPARIYFYADYDIRKNKEKFNGFLNELGFNKSNIVIFKINVRNSKYLDFYQDTAMKYDRAVFTYNNIPARFIEGTIKIK